MKKRVALASLTLGVGLVAALPSVASARSYDPISGTLVNTCHSDGNSANFWIELWNDEGHVTSVATDPDGGYVFEDRNPGHYTVKPAMPAGCGAVPTTREADTTDGPALGIDFRMVAVHDIIGTVSGCAGAAGAGIAGVTVNLVDGEDGIVDSTETTHDGYYFFQWKEAKDGYTVEVLPPAGCDAAEPVRPVDLTNGDAVDVDFVLAPIPAGSLQSLFSGFDFGS